MEAEPGIGRRATREWRSNILAITDEDVWFAGGPDYKLYVTHDGANTVQEVSLPVPNGIDPDDYSTYGLPVFTDNLTGYEEVTYTGAGDDKAAAALFSTNDGGRTWKQDRILANLAPGTAGDHPSSAIAGSKWILSFGGTKSERRLMKLAPKSGATDGANSDLKHYNCDLSFITTDEGWMNCSGTLSATVDGGTTLTDITPRARNGSNGVLTTDPIQPAPTPKPLKTIEIKPAFGKSGAAAVVPQDTLPGHLPYVSGVDQHLGFDRTDVLLTSEMDKWWNSSPYYDVGIYLPGSPNRHNDKNLMGKKGLDWVDATIGQGWGIIPIWFGLQAPCGGDNTPDTKTYSSKDAATKGREQADLAYNSAANLGLDGTIIYFDIEPYNTLSKECSAAVRDYIGAIVNEMHNNAWGGSVGVYGAVDAAGGDFYNASPRPDDIWVAQRLGKRVTVWDLAAGVVGQTLNTALTDDLAWTDHQRMHQYRIPYKNRNKKWADQVLETWGGAGPYNVDEDIVDATIVPGKGVKDQLPISYTTVSNVPDINSLWGINNGVNNSGLKVGEAVGVYTTPDLIGETFTYLDGKETAEILETGAISTYPGGINNLGQIVGSYDLGQIVYGNSEVTLTFGFYAPSNNAPLQTLYYPGATYTYLNGINDAGWIIGNYTNDNVTFHCVLFKPDKKGAYSSANAISFDAPGATSTECHGINGLGQILANGMVNAAEGGDPVAPANFSPIPPIVSASGMTPLAVNNNGLMVVNAYFFFNGSELVYIQQQDNIMSYALYGINDDAQMVGMLTEPIVGGVQGPVEGLILDVLPTQP